MLDRGFIFGDGVYEVVPVYGRKLFRFDEHLARLAAASRKLRIDNPHSREQWLERCASWSPRWSSTAAPATSSSTSRSRAAWRCATT